jgi:hypothetical protein
MKHIRAAAMSASGTIQMKTGGQGVVIGGDDQILDFVRQLADHGGGEGV